MWLPSGVTRELGAQTHADRAALRRGTFVLGLGSSGGHLGLFWAVLAPFWPILTSRGPFWPFLAVMWPPTGATWELRAQTHVNRVALHRETFVQGSDTILGAFRPILGCFGPFLAHFGLQGPILAIFSSKLAADWRHTGVGGPNLLGRSALGRRPFGLREC